MRDSCAVAVINGVNWCYSPGDVIVLVGHGIPFAAVDRQLFFFSLLCVQAGILLLLSPSRYRSQRGLRLPPPRVIYSYWRSVAPMEAVGQDPMYPRTALACCLVESFARPPLDGR